MKILMTVIMAMSVSTSIYAAKCDVGGACTVEADCKANGDAKDYALNAGKCVKVTAAEAATHCEGIVQSKDKTPAQADAPADSTGSSATHK